MIGLIIAATLTLKPYVAGVGTGPNLARQAKATASETYQSFTADKGMDGDERSRWSGIPGHNAGVWYELDWSEPVTIGEVVVRQYDRFTMEFDVQTWDPSTRDWVAKSHHGRPGERLTKNVVCRIAPTQTTKLRIGNITNGPSFTEVEVYSDPREHPPVLEMASDLRGNLIGMLTDTLGASPVDQASVILSGDSPNGPWTKTVPTDRYGMFTCPMPVACKGTIRAKVEGGTETSFSTAAFQYGLTPLDTRPRLTSLNGKWKFALDPSDRFVQPDFDDSAWSEIKVPAHWEMEGFRSLTGIAGYRKSFARPPGNGRLKLRFDGVYSGAEVFVNGQLVATHEGGFTPFEADITDIADRPSNVLAVRVREHTNVSDNLDKMSLYADFPLGGIIRKVTLFRVPNLHLGALDQSSKLDSDGSARIVGKLAILNESPRAAQGNEIAITLRSPDGKESRALVRRAFGATPWDRSEVPFEIRVQQPRYWTAEQPNLYSLEIQLRSDGKAVQTLSQQVGIRETRIEGTQILINGSPVKFRGTCHHDTHPTMGRAVTPELTKLDLNLIKGANLNSVRTSHYPPIPELVEYADQIGLYVEDEADFCWVGVSNDLRNTPRIIQLTAELLARDRNHPSVFEWSLCNESEFGFGFERSHEWVRSVDPSRPTSAATSAWTEIATLHNPIAISRINENENLDKPLLFDESLCIYQGIFNDVAEMWVDPGMRDYYAEPLPEIYRVFMASRTTQGSMIWCWADDIFAVPGRGLEYGRGTAQSHFVESAYRMPGRGLVGDAPWGVVDGWRRLKPEYWITKKLHSPVRLEERSITPTKGGEALTIPVENQFDFTNLSELKFVAQPPAKIVVNVSPRSIGTLTVKPDAPLRSGTTLELSAFSSDGRLIDTFRFPIGSTRAPAPPSTHYRPQPLQMFDEDTLAGSSTHILGGNFELAFDSGGYLRRCVGGGAALLLELPMLHVLPTERPLVPLPDRLGWHLESMSFDRQGDNVAVHIKGSYPMFSGGYELVVTPAGRIIVDSRFTYSGPDMFAREVGLRLSLPRECDRLAWSRNGEWNVYPDDHIGRPVGIADAFPPAHKVGEGSWASDPSPMGSNDFRSTKRHINWVWLGYPNGPGIAVESNGKQSSRAMIDTDRVSLHVNDWFGGTNVGWWEWMHNYGRGQAIKTGDVLSSHLELTLQW